MNICMFTNTYLPHVGGVARSVNIFAEDLRRMGHRVLVVAPRFGSESGDDQWTLRLPAIQNFNSSDFAVRIPLPFIVEREIESFDPHIIHSHHPFLLGATALRAARKKNLPLVFTHHTLYERYTHYIPLHSDKLEIFVSRLATLYANFCNHVIAPSQSIADLIRSRGVKSPIEVIPTGVDTSFFASGRGDDFRKKNGISSEDLVIGHIGRLAPEKNLKFLSSATAEFLSARPDGYFMVVGKGPSEADIERIFQKAGLGERLIMTGQLGGRDLRNAYQAMDLFVFSSQTETQGMVLVEAMAAGKPVIALEASGTREVVEDGKNGRLLPADISIHGFAAAIEQWAECADECRRWPMEALKTAELFSRNRSARRLNDLYETIIERISAEPSADYRELGALDALTERIRTAWDILTQVTSSIEGIQEDEKK